MATPSRSGADPVATVEWATVHVPTPAIKAYSLVSPDKGVQVEVCVLGPGCEGLSQVGCYNPSRAEPVSLEGPGTACHVYLAPACVHCICCGQGLISSSPLVRPAAGFSQAFSCLACCLL